MWGKSKRKNFFGGKFRFIVFHIVNCMFFLPLILIIIISVSSAATLDELEQWAHDNFWGHYTPAESLDVEIYRSIADGDWQVAAYLFSARSFVEFGTIDSALLDIAYCLGRSGDFDNSRDALRRAIEIYGGENPQVVYVDAMLNIWSGNVRKARRILRSCLKKQKADYDKYFLKIALGIADILYGKTKKGFSLFRDADGISKLGTGTPDFEVRLFGQRVSYHSVIGTLYVRQYFGRPSVILRIRPVFRWSDGSRYSAEPLAIEQVAQIFGSPYFQVATERTGEILIPRWRGIPVGGEMSMWIVYIDESENLDSCYVVVSGELRGFPPADSFGTAVKDLRAKSIEMWFDTLMSRGSNIDQPFWRFILSYRISHALADSTRWQEGAAVVDSIIENAPFLSEMYLWRGAFSLFQERYEEAYKYFSAPLERDSC